LLALALLALQARQAERPVRGSRAEAIVKARKAGLGSGPP
jgi:hypothetical protein